MQPIELIVAGFEGFNSAEQAAQELRNMDREDTLSLLNTVVIKKDARGHKD